MCERLFSQSHGSLPRVTTIMLVLGILCIAFSLPLAAYEKTSGPCALTPHSNIHILARDFVHGRRTS